jgi:hypothetical protein
MPVTVKYQVSNLVPMAASSAAVCDLAAWTASNPASVDIGCSPSGNGAIGGAGSISLTSGGATITGSGFGTAVSKFTCKSNKYDSPQLTIKLPTTKKNSWTPQSDQFDVEICVNGSSNCIVQTISY